MTNSHVRYAPNFVSDSIISLPNSPSDQMKSYPDGPAYVLELIADVPTGFVSFFFLKGLEHGLVTPWV